MADYHGSSGNDVITQSLLGLPDFSNFYGEDGADTFVIGKGTAIGGSGNDQITGTDPFSTVAYWTSPAAIHADLSTGIVQDGFGFVNQLVNIHTLQAAAMMT